MQIAIISEKNPEEPSTLAITPFERCEEVDYLLNTDVVIRFHKLEH